MKVVVLGGTRFVGAHVVRLLAQRGHDVTIVHRGETEAELPEEVRHVHIPFARLSDELDGLRSSGADVVLDMVPYLDKGGHGVLRFHEIADRGVVITSCDVYRAFGRLWRSEPGPPDAVPLTERSPLRSQPAADSCGEEVAYDNIEVEQAVLDGRLPVTILRLPATHGPGDPQHRLFRYLKRMDDQRPVVVLEEGLAGWRWTRGYVENVAAAIALAVEGVRQEYVVDSSRIRRELGYSEKVSEEKGLEQTIEWERRNPPDAAFAADYAAEDEALEAYRRHSQG